MKTHTCMKLSLRTFANDNQKHLHTNFLFLSCIMNILHASDMLCTIKLSKRQLDHACRDSNHNQSYCQAKCMT